MVGAKEKEEGARGLETVKVQFRSTLVSYMCFISSWALILTDEMIFICIQTSLVPFQAKLDFIYSIIIALRHLIFVKVGYKFTNTSFTTSVFNKLT